MGREMTIERLKPEAVCMLIDGTEISLYMSCNLVTVKPLSGQGDSYIADSENVRGQMDPEKQKEAFARIVFARLEPIQKNMELFEKN